MMTRSTPLVLAACAVLATACETTSTGPGPSTPPTVSLDTISNQPILDWNAFTFDLFPTGAAYNPMDATRILAMVHLAQHDALASIEPKFGRYALDGALDRRADPEVAVASAAHSVLVAKMPERRAAIDARLAEVLAGRPGGDARTRGVELGARAGAAILARRSDDGSATPIIGDYTPRNEPGAYQYVAPYDFVAAPGWRDVAPFSLEKAAQFRPAPLPALSSEAYAAAFEEVKAFGGKQSTVRTADQLAYAKYWYETSETGWNRIARVVAADRKLGLQATARLFALLHMAMSDAYVAGWDAKFHYDAWRPTTAIRNAETDGNPATVADLSWESAEITPPVQDYPSTHSALGAAAAEVLATVFGDRTAFTMASPTAEPAGATRSFASFREAAAENADSRVRAGLHFRFACDAGLELGRQIGRWTVEHQLRRAGQPAASADRGVVESVLGPRSVTGS